MAKYPVSGTRVAMYDTVDASQVPASAVKLAGYVDGGFKSHASLVRRFPKSRVFGITVLGTNWEQASILDWEKGDVQNSDTLRRFVNNRNAAFPETACVYVAHTNLAQVDDFLEGLWRVYWVGNWGAEPGEMGVDLTGQRSPGGSLIVGTQVLTQPDPDFDLSKTLPSWK